MSWRISRRWPLEVRAARWGGAVALAVHSAVLAAAVGVGRRGAAVGTPERGWAAVTLDVVGIACAPAGEAPASQGVGEGAPAGPGAGGCARVAQEESGPRASPEAEEMLPGSHARAGPEAIALARLRSLIEREKFYPEAARRAGYEGEVMMLVRVDAEGTVASHRVVSSRGHFLLEQAAVRTLERVTGRRLGISLPHEIWARVPIRFQIEPKP